MNEPFCPWSTRQPTAPPGPGRIHVWCADRRVPGPVRDGLLAHLSADELERAARLTTDMARRRFALGRGILRQLLGRYLERAPEEIPLRSKPGTRPALDAAAAPPAIRIGVSHADRFSLYVFATDQGPGVDIERVAALPETEGIATREFAAEEREQIAALDPSSRPLAFALAWTRKEAVLKAMDEGLTRRLDSFAVTCSPGEPARVLRAPVGADPPESWSLYPVDPAPGWVATVACRKKAVLDRIRWSPA